jgi:shikimate kinase
MQKTTKSIVLIGMMGVGKTTIGKSLARKLGIPFVDSDHEISSQHQLSIPDIFSEYGEEYFRKAETDFISYQLTKEPAVLATGGGAFTIEATRKAILDQATSVWLYADVQTLLSRLEGSRNRPLLNTGDRQTTLENLIDKRYPLYKFANLHIDTSRARNADEATEFILSKLF